MIACAIIMGTILIEYIITILKSCTIVMSLIIHFYISKNITKNLFIIVFCGFTCTDEGQCYTFKCTAPSKCTFSYFDNAIRYNYACKSGTTPKRIITYTRYAIWYSYARNRRIGKRITAYTHNGFSVISGRDYNIKVFTRSDSC